MKIGFDAKRATHNFRGLGNYSRGLIDGILKYYPAEYLYLYSPNINDKRGHDWINSLTGNIILKEPDSFLEKKLNSFWRSFLLSTNFEKDNLDIFHGLSHEIPYQFTKKSKIKSAVTMHDLIYLRYPEFFPYIDRVVYNQKFRYACKNSDIIIAICEQTKKDLIQFFGIKEDKIIVHYQSCSTLFYNKLSNDDLNLVRLKYKINKSFILHVGAFEERKNQLNLVEAFYKISNQIEENLVLVGSGKRYKNQVLSRIKELNLSNRVIVLDSVLHTELPALYQMASLFCFPSLFEGFGIPIIESLFSKTPVLTSFGSCFPESAGPDAYYIDPLSVSSIGDGILAILNNADLRTKMISNGHDYVQQFHDQETTSKLIDIYQKLLS